MSSHHPKSAYAELLSLREFVAEMVEQFETARMAHEKGSDRADRCAARVKTAGDIYAEINRRLATVDLGEKPIERHAGLSMVQCDYDDPGILPAIVGAIDVLDDRLQIIESAAAMGETKPANDGPLKQFLDAVRTNMRVDFCSTYALTELCRRALGRDQ